MNPGKKFKKDVTILREYNFKMCNVKFKQFQVVEEFQVKLIENTFINFCYASELLIFVPPLQFFAILSPLLLSELMQTGNILQCFLLNIAIVTLYYTTDLRLLEYLTYILETTIEIKV